LVVAPTVIAGGKGEGGSNSAPQWDILPAFIDIAGSDEKLIDTNTQKGISMFEGRRMLQDKSIEISRRECPCEVHRSSGKNLSEQLYHQTDSASEKNYSRTSHAQQENMGSDLVVAILHTNVVVNSIE
jgi:hypothetical protein